MTFRPQSSFPTLPIEHVIPDLLKTISLSSNIVLQAPPGAGKTTRAPLALLDLPCFAGSRIVLLEPRRLATVNAAVRMARCLGEEVGETVGYTMRFERKVSARTRLEVVTEGILTRRLQNDPCLEGVGLVIFDEFHERSIHADLALALCMEVQREVRPDLRILVMSATMDCGPVASLLGNAPVIASEGRSFPVDVRYIEESGHTSLPVRMTAAIRRALGETGGDVLAFLPGSGEIRACCELLRRDAPDPGVEIHPLYGDLPFAEQERAILPASARKVVLSTNIAETSLTIEGVHVVVDSGLSRMVRHDPSSGMNRLVTVRESRASAEQRSGRAGRLGPGTCYRLFGRHTFNAMTAFSQPEILVSDLSSLVLELAVWGVTDPGALSWLDPPPEAAFATARDLLRELGAFDRTGRLTGQGRRMAELPVHPRIARMLLRGIELGAQEISVAMAALLSEKDIFRYNPGEVAAVCESDLLERYESLTQRKKDADSRLQPGAIRAVERTMSQLSRLVPGKPGRSNGSASPELLASLLLSAYPDRVAKQREEGSGRYLLAGGRGVRLSAKSGVRDRSFILAVHVDAGKNGEGVIHQACALSPGLIRSECGDRIELVGRVTWDPGQDRVTAWEEEVIGSVTLSRRRGTPSDDEALPVLLEHILDTRMESLGWNPETRRFLGRIRLMRTAFPEEEWPDLGEEQLTASIREWLGPFLSGVRSARELASVDLLSALRAPFSRERLRQMDERAPTHVSVPSGRRVEIDYVTGEEPILAIKLQEMFGLADTPAIAGGRVKLLLHLLSPAGRPVQVTRDLKGFWDKGYQDVKKELRGRYPRHPWPDDPWNALPTRMTNRMLKGRK